MDIASDMIRVCGKVDEVPGFFYVGTKFVEWPGTPLIPVGGMIVVNETPGRRWDGLDCKLSFRSLVKTYLQWYLSIAGTMAMSLSPALIAMSWDKGW